MTKQQKLKWSGNPCRWIGHASRGAGGRYEITPYEGWSTVTGYNGIVRYDVRRLVNTTGPGAWNSPGVGVGAN